MGSEAPSGFLPLPAEEDFKAAVAQVRETHWYARGPIRDGVRATLEELHTKLAECTELYETGGLDDQRYAVVDALSAIQNFLVGQGFNPNVLKPVHRPIEALLEQYNNGLDPMFAERRNSDGGRRKDSPDKHHRAGVLAALAQYWIDTHPKGDQQQQLSAAARRFKGRFFGSVTAKELDAARRAISKYLRERAMEHPAVNASLSVRRMIDGYAADYGPQNAITLAIWHLNHIPPATGTGNWRTIKSALERL